MHKRYRKASTYIIYMDWLLRKLWYCMGTVKACRYCSTFARFSFQLFREVFLEQSSTHETAPWMKCRCCSWHLEVAATHSLIRRKKLKQQEVLWPRLAGFSKAPQQFFETTTSFTALISPLPHIFAHTLRNYRVIMSNCILWFLSDILIHSLISKDVPSY